VDLRKEEEGKNILFKSLFLKPKSVKINLNRSFSSIYKADGFKKCLCNFFSFGIANNVFSFSGG
jgi:ASC-1-like (ASCH) protein